MPLIGPYELGERLGEAGTSRVFVATGPDGEDVALKVLREGGEVGSAELARFEREAELAESLDHPHLIGVIDHGVDDERGPWLAMPLLRGMTLRDLFGGRTLGPDAAIALVAPVIDALAALHAAGLVHRDVRPDNVMLSPVGGVTLVDFGLGLADVDARYLGEGRVRGAVGYMSPERVEGRDVDPSADVWAVGVMIYELVSGARPFARDTEQEELEAIAAASFAPLAEIDRRVSNELDWLVSVCLARDPWKRPRDGGALLERVRPMMFGALDEARETRVSVLSDLDAFEVRVASKARSRAPVVVEPSVTKTEAPATRRTPWLPLVVALALLSTVSAVLVLHSSSETSERGASGASSLEGTPTDAGTDAAQTSISGPLRFEPIPPNLLSNDDAEDLADLMVAENDAPEMRDDLGDDDHVASGLLALREGRLDDAEASFTSAVASDQENQRALRHRGVLRRRLGHTRDAYEDLVRALRLDPDDALALAEMVEIFELANRRVDALPFARRLVRVDPSAESLLSLSLTLVLVGDEQSLVEAMMAARDAAETDPTNAAAQRHRCSLLSMRGEPRPSRIRRTLQAGAAAACTEAILRAPRDPELFVWRARALGAEERWVPALADADRAVELEPQTASLYASRANLRSLAGDETGSLRDHALACQLGHEASCERIQGHPPTP